LCIGLFATKSVNSHGADGLFYGGGFDQLGKQALTLFVVIIYSLVATLLIGLLIDGLVGNRLRPRQERVGLDMVEHGELAYAVGTAELPLPTDLQEPVASHVSPPSEPTSNGVPDGSGGAYSSQAPDDANPLRTDEWRLVQKS
jgi:hypothetical protein